MTECRHAHLVLLPPNSQRLRCRRCHLTIRAAELGSGHCPECFETGGVRHADFEVVESPEETRYRCEECGALIEYRLYER